jgi:hypothetical protein
MSELKMEQTIDTTYTQFKNMCFKKAHEFHKKYKINWDDISAEVSLIFCEAFREYERKLPGVSFSTYLYNQLNWRLYKYVKKYFSIYEKENTTENTFFNSILYFDISEKCILFKDQMEKFDSDCKYVFHLICFPDRRERKELHRVNKKNIKRYLRKKHWSHNRIDQCFYKISKELFHEED